MDYGTLIYTNKGKRYCGKSEITHKALYKVLYTLYFYKDGEPIKGYIADNKPFTFNKSFYKKSDMNKFLNNLMKT